MNTKIAIYVRRSVSDQDKGNNSLSIDAQKAECIKYVGEDADYRIYCDDGKSGKDIMHRPAFLQMMADAKEGLIDYIVVKKYDRFSRNMREYLNVTNELDSYGVGVVSLSEPFNTSTKEGRMMRNNLLNFAEFERETIAARVADAYNTKARETGFYQGGKMYYGYTSERRTVNGKTGSVLVPSEQAVVVQKAYELYQKPETSLSDIINYLRLHEIEVAVASDTFVSKKTNMDRSHISKLLASPLYVRADKDIYQYFVSKGVCIIDDIEAFDGVHGLFIHRPKGSQPYIKVGYHEGLVDSDVWLAVQDKKSHNKRVPSNGTCVNSWLTGLVKCEYCKHGLAVSYCWNAAHTKQWRYFSDRGAYLYTGCKKKFLTTRPDDAERIVFEAMKKRLESLVIAKHEKHNPDASTEAVKAEMIKLDDEIRKLMDKLADADSILFDYIQKRITELHKKKSDLEEKLRSQVRKHKSIDTKPLENPMKNWDKLTNQEKHELAATMIDVIYISDENGIDIRFSI